MNWIIKGQKSKITSERTKKQEVNKSVQMLHEITMGIDKTGIYTTWTIIKYSSSGDIAGFAN